MATYVRKLCLKNCSLMRQMRKLDGLRVVTPILTYPGIQKYDFGQLYCSKVRFQPISRSLKNQNDMKPSLLQRFKQMYRDYWYVLVPVHLVTSAAWFGGFYYLAKSGVDIVGILESWNVSEKITNSLKDSSMGYLAVAYALYKISTPIRYTVTLGGTTLSINYLKQWGYIKPVPSRDQLKVMYKERKDNIIESIKETRGFYKEKKEDFIESVKDNKTKLKLKTEFLKCQKNSLVKDLEDTLEKNVKTGLKHKPKEYLKITKKNEDQ
ncbi:hypothetical protein FQA39_LY15738 [Lamprigera yunnana]|nr:hypothetical protein FQA39_LY15738 [Lamprigera yunnana]